MKKFLSVLLAIIIMATSCTCAMTIFAADTCSSGHTVTKWMNNNKINHIGYCDVCNALVKKTHKLEPKEVYPVTCEKNGYTYYACVCGYGENRDVVETTGHDIISTTYNYDQNGDGKFTSDDVFYTKTIVCRNSDACGTKVVEGTIGNSNYCPNCEKYNLLSKTVVNATCKLTGHTIYNCATVYKDEDGNEVSCSRTVYEGPLAAHRYETKVVEATCEANGYTEHKCKICNTSYVDNELPAKGHSMDLAGKSYEYNYDYNGVKDKCAITGICARGCNYGAAFTVEKINTPAPICEDCNQKVTYKKITYPATCEEGAQVTLICGCGEISYEAKPLGHDAKTVEYTYNDDGTVSVKVDCNRCDSETTNETEYLEAVNCSNCSTKLEKRVVVAATCEKNGYVKITCPECGECSESVIRSIGHKTTYGTWTYTRDADVVVFKANCEREGCSGYTYEGAIGTTGFCGRCGRDTLLSKTTYYQTCESQGYTNATCSYCGSYENFDIKTTLAHNYDSVHVDADCEVGGYTLSTCVDCLYSKKSDVTDPIGHSGDVKQIYYTSNSTKVEHGFCNKCAEPYITPEMAIVSGENICKKCNSASITSKYISDPDCFSMTNGYTTVSCTSCGSYQTDIINADHNFGDWVVVYDSTCAKVGLKQRTCRDCKSVENEEIPIDTTSTGAPKHQYLVIVKGIEPTCTEAGLSDEMCCISCGIYKQAEVLAPTGHLLDDDGINKNFCVRCNSYLFGQDDAVISCSCICHNEDGLAKFFFKFILFFCQILGINKSCECGKIHY